MKSLFLVLTTFALGATTSSDGEQIMTEDATQKQTLYRADSRPAIKGSPHCFTGNVTVQPLFGPQQPDAPFSAASVTFEPGARSFWHTHPTGQHLIVTDGVGLTGTVDGTIEEFKTGDALWCPRGVKHWHGASPTSSMTHLALTGTMPDGKNVEWMEEVSDEDYRGGRN